MDYEAEIIDGPVITPALNSETMEDFHEGKQILAVLIGMTVFFDFFGVLFLNIGRGFSLWGFAAACVFILIRIAAVLLFFSKKAGNKKVIKTLFIIFAGISICGFAVTESRLAVHIDITIIPLFKGLNSAFIVNEAIVNFITICLLLFNKKVKTYINTDRPEVFQNI